MDIREMVARRLKSIMATFCGSILATYIYMIIFQIDSMRIYVITTLIVLAFIIELSHIVLYSKKEPSSNQMFIRHVVHMIIIMIIVSSATAYMGLMDIRDPLEVLVVMGLIVIVYMVILLTGLHQIKQLSDRMNKRLRERYKKH